MDDLFCVNGCGRLATTERILGIIMDGSEDFNEVVELVCERCA